MPVTVVVPAARRHWSLATRPERFAVEPQRRTGSRSFRPLRIAPPRWGPGPSGGPARARCAGRRRRRGTARLAEHLGRVERPPPEVEWKSAAISLPSRAAPGRPSPRPRRRARRLGRDAAVDLAAHVGVEVEALAAEAVGERVRARGDRLRLQRLVGPRARHLLRHDAARYCSSADDVDRVSFWPGDGDLELAAVGAAELERRVPGRKRIGPASSVGVPLTVTRSFGPSATAGRQRIGLPEDVPHAERRPRRIVTPASTRRSARARGRPARARARCRDRSAR